MDISKQLQDIHSYYSDIKTEMQKRIVGQDDTIDALLIAFFTGGHSLLVGVPGLAKTMMIQTLADVMDLSFKRIQFTPDLMPSDITGTDVIEENRETGERAFRFIPGPVFGNIILADEINRTPPKTQSALLEAMQEHHVTVGGKSYDLKAPFFVLATQNPIEQEGTYPLPEAQLDRFMFQLNVAYPSEMEEKEIVKRTTGKNEITLNKIMDQEKLIKMQDFIRQIPVSDHVIDETVRMVRQTRPEETHNHEIKEYVKWGAGPRASQYIILAAKTRAALMGKATPEMEDIQAVTHLVLRHRILRSFKAEADGITVDKLIDSLFNK